MDTPPFFVVENRPDIAFAEPWGDIVYWTRSPEPHGVQPEVGQLGHPLSIGVEAIHGGETLVKGCDVCRLISMGSGGLQNGLVIGKIFLPDVPQLVGEWGVLQVAGDEGAAGDLAWG